MDKTANCVVCGKAVTYKFYLCAECEGLYGKRKAQWPGWVRFLVNDDMKVRVGGLRGNDEREVSFTDLGLDIHGVPEDADEGG